MYIQIYTSISISLSLCIYIYIYIYIHTHAMAYYYSNAIARWGADFFFFVVLGWGLGTWYNACSKSYTAQELSHGTNEIVSAIASNNDYHLYQPFIIASTTANLQKSFDSQDINQSRRIILLSLLYTFLLLQTI